MGLVEKPEMTQTSLPACSVCIANYNGESLLVDCLNSVLNQQCSFPFEIIVHDDASTDNSLELLESRFPQIHVIRSSDNVGYCISNNRMVTQASGQLLTKFSLRWRSTPLGPSSSRTNLLRSRNRTQLNLRSTTHDRFEQSKGNHPGRELERHYREGWVLG